MADGYVETPYGRVPGCPECGLIPLTRAAVCEHGVTPAPRLEVSFKVTINDRALYDRLVGGDARADG